MSNIKPNWKKAPEWAKWLAQDHDGSWYWYADKPTPATSGSGVWVRATTLSKQQKYIEHGDDWSLTLEKRP